MLCRVRWVAANMQHSVKDSSPDVTIPNVSPDNLLCCQECWKEKKLETPSSSSEGTNADVKEGLCLSDCSHMTSHSSIFSWLNFANGLAVNLPRALHSHSSNSYYDCWNTLLSLTEIVQLAVYFSEYFSIIRKYKVPTVIRFEVPFIQSMQCN